MRVVIHLSKFVDWVPVPADVKVTEEDIAAGKVMPGRDGGAYRMRVVKEPKGGTFRTCHINEADIVGKIVHEKTDVRRAGRTLSRKEAVAHFIMDHLLDDYAWDWITKIEVDDDGPDEALARSILAPHTTATHGRRGGTNINPSHVEDIVKAYAAPTVAADHVAHLHAHFGVKAVS